MTGSQIERIPIFQRRPALVVLAALASGIAAGGTFGNSPSVLQAVILAFASSLALAAIFRKRSAILMTAATLLACFLFGVLLVAASAKRGESSALARFAGLPAGEVGLIGTITNVREDGGFFRLQCEALETKSSTIAISEAAGVFLGRDRAKGAFRRGDRVKVIGELVSFEGSERNPYAFDYNTYLRTSENIDAAIYCNSRFDIIRRGHRKPALYDNILDFFVSLRSDIKEIISGIVTDTLTRGFILAMLLGDRHALSEEVWEDFQQAGLTHLLVVSGFNLALVGWILYYILRFILRFLRRANRGLKISFVMAGTLFFGFLVGIQPSVTRAVIFGEILLLSKLLERKPDLANITASAALINLIFQPLDLFNIGFQLSYGAVFSLTLIAPAIDRYLLPKKNDAKPKTRRWREKILRGMIGTSAVLIGTFPIVLFHFHQVSLIAILANLVTIPLASVATIISVFLIPLAAISPSLASLYADALGVIVHLMTAVARYAGQAPFAIVRLPHPSALFLVLYSLGILYVIRSKLPRVALMRFAGVTALVFAFAAMRFGLTDSLIDDGKLSVLFFDVGQGDAALITTPGGKRYIVDCGGIARSGTSIAERAIFPTLEAEGIRQIDGAFLTHLHLDHFGGFVSLAARNELDTLYTCGGRSALPIARSLDSIVSIDDMPIEILRYGRVIALDKNVAAYILNPEAIGDTVMNERSLVMKIVYGKTSVLFLGDIHAEIERDLARRYGDFLKCELVKVAHHGSRSSSSPELVSLTRPRYAVFSVGRNNHYGHPHAEVLARWRDAGATLARTDEDGALLFRSDGHTAERTLWR